MPLSFSGGLGHEMPEKKKTSKKTAPKKAPAKKKVVKLDEVVRLIRSRISLNFETRLAGPNKNELEVIATWTPIAGITKAQFKEQVQKEVKDLIAAAILE